MPHQNTLRLILGDQLNENHDWFKQPDKNVTYVLMEIRQETDYLTHHIQKVATKPYISSAKYIHSMSDYCGTCDYNWKQRHGYMACPFNSLYWNFFERHRPLLHKNPRVGMMDRVWDRMDSREKGRVLKQADACLDDINRL